MEEEAREVALSSDTIFRIIFTHLFNRVIINRYKSIILIKILIKNRRIVNRIE